MILLTVCIILMLVLAIYILLGKGDWLIAGYNTLSESEKQNVNLPRLRIVVAVMCLITAAWLVSFFFVVDSVVAILLGLAFTVVAVIAVIVANIWAVKK